MANFVNVRITSNNLFFWLTAIWLARYVLNNLAQLSIAGPAPPFVFECAALAANVKARAVANVRCDDRVALSVQ